MKTADEEEEIMPPPEEMMQIQEVRVGGAA
jgi:hypothetical protein